MCKQIRHYRLGRRQPLHPSPRAIGDEGKAFSRRLLDRRNCSPLQPKGYRSLSPGTPRHWISNAAKTTALENGPTACFPLYINVDRS